MTKEEKILGAVARGWCYPENENKEMDVDLATAIANEVTLEMSNVVDLAYRAWIVIANASEGNWDRETEEWQDAAARWRDDFHALLQEILPNGNTIREE